MKTLIKNQKFFDLYLEYTEEATAYEKEYRVLEGKFALAFGYLPIRIEDETFPHLEERQQSACAAFWKNPRVIAIRKSLDTARALAETYFDSYSGRMSK